MGISLHETFDDDTKARHIVISAFVLVTPRVFVIFHVPEEMVWIVLMMLCSIDEHGICGRSGCLMVDDEIVRFNGRSVAAASIDSVCRIMYLSRFPMLNRPHLLFR